MTIKDKNTVRTHSTTTYVPFLLAFRQPEKFLHFIQLRRRRRRLRRVRRASRRRHHVLDDGIIRGFLDACLSPRRRRDATALQESL